jgi:tripartite-type tricarboxylate transporter receptor subunit TctC
MTLPRYLRHVILLGALAYSIGAGAQPRPGDYPNRPIRVIVAQAAGSGVDLLTRIVARKLSDALGQQVIVENRPGANGIIGLEGAAKSKPDGYTFAMGWPGSIILNLYIYKSLPYDTFRDFAPVIQTSTNLFGFVVNPSLPVRSVKEVAALAKKHPGELRYGSFGAGNMTHLAAELFAQNGSFTLLHVPFKGETPSLVALLGGEIGMMLTPMQAAAPYVRERRLRLLATLGEKRATAFPDVPSMNELGYREMVIAGWSGMLAPTGTPAEIIARMQQETARVLQVPETRDYLAQQGADTVASSSDQFAAFIKAEAAKWSRVIKATGLTHTQ